MSNFPQTIVFVILRTHLKIDNTYIDNSYIYNTYPLEGFKIGYVQEGNLRISQLKQLQCRKHFTKSTIKLIDLIVGGGNCNISPIKCRKFRQQHYQIVLELSLK